MYHLSFLLYSIQFLLLYSSLIFCCASAAAARENKNKIVQHEHVHLTEEDIDDTGSTINGSSTARTRPMVFGLGPGRTGTDSLREALVELGFGPTYHMREILFEHEGISTDGHSELFHKAARASQDQDKDQDPVDFQHIFKEYNSGCDWPLSAFPDELLAAFPDAKFILTTRSSKSWHKSIHSSICKFNANQYPLKFLSSKYIHPILGKPFSIMGAQTDMMDAIMKYKFAPGLASSWSEMCQSEQIATDAMEQWNERVKRIIPPHQLFIFELGVHGYRELDEFLNDTEDDPSSSSLSTTAYPRVNSTKEFRKIMNIMWFLCILLHVLMIGVPAALINIFVKKYLKKKEIVTSRMSSNKED